MLVLAMEFSRGGAGHERSGRHGKRPTAGRALPSIVGTSPTILEGAMLPENGTEVTGSELDHAEDTARGR